MRRDSQEERPRVARPSDRWNKHGHTGSLTFHRDVSYNVVSLDEAIICHQSALTFYEYVVQHNWASEISVNSIFVIDDRAPLSFLQIEKCIERALNMKSREK